MPSERHRGLYRIATNYGRLAATMGMGIVTVPLQIAWLGLDGFGLLGLIGSSVGIGRMLQDMMRHSMVRELGAAWHRDDGEFRKCYASAYLVCAIVAVLTAIFFALLMFIVPLLRIKEEWVAPSQWILGAEGVATCVIVFFSPTINMLVVKERFLSHNTWTVARRSSYLIATVIPMYMMGITDSVQGLTVYGTLVMVVNLVATGLLLIWIIAGDRRMLPRMRGASREALREVAGTFGWNSSVVLAMNLHSRVSQYIMNLLFGLWGNAVFSLALRLVSYVRMASLGMTFGLDAVSARLSSTDENDTLKAMFRHSTRLLSFVAFPAMVVVFFLAEPLLRLWIGSATQDPHPESGLPVFVPAEVLVKIMVIGLAARAVSDGWLKLFYGGGHIRRYAPLVLAGGLLNPVLTIGLYFLLPDAWRYTSVGIAIAAIYLVIHFFWIPAKAGGGVGLHARDIIAPACPALLAALLSAPTLLLAAAVSSGEHIGWLGVGVAVGCYAAAYAVLSWILMLNSSERSSVLRLLRRQAAG